SVRRCQNLRNSHRNQVHDIPVWVTSIQAAICGVFRHGCGASRASDTLDLSARPEKRSGAAGNRPIRFLGGRLAGRRVTLADAHPHNAPDGRAVPLQYLESELPDPPSPHVGDCLSRGGSRVCSNPSIPRSVEALDWLTINGHDVRENRGYTEIQDAGPNSER